VDAPATIDKPINRARRYNGIAALLLQVLDRPPQSTDERHSAWLR
jgi:hypothetical protein